MDQQVAPGQVDLPVPAVGIADDRDSDLHAAAVAQGARAQGHDTAPLRLHPRPGAIDDAAFRTLAGLPE
jgi:hypothetical protein